jgi:hypothetical protein
MNPIGIAVPAPVSGITCLHKDGYFPFITKPGRVDLGLIRSAPGLYQNIPR